jgi:hypothetical protein
MKKTILVLISLFSCVAGKSQEVVSGCYASNFAIIGWFATEITFNEDRKYFRQQFAMLGKLKWEEGKINGATIITQSKVNEIFRRSFLKRIFRINNGWKKFKRKYGGCLTSLSLPIFNVNQDYCIIYEWTQCHYLAGSGKLSVYHFENGQWIFVKAYSYGMS